jgi:lambda family phage portal protein
MKQRIRVKAGDRIGASARLVARSHKAAKSDRLVSFAFGGSSPAKVLERDFRGLVDHSRVALRNNDYLRGWIKLLRRNVVGARGVELRSLAETRGGEADAEARAAVARAWRAWGKRGEATTCGRLTLRDVQALALATCARDGLFIARHVRGARAGRFGYRLQVLSVDHIDLDRTVERLRGGGFIRQGLEFDADDRLVAAWLFSAPRDELRGQASATRVLARDLVVTWFPEEACQTIGKPWAHTALRTLQMTDGFEEAGLANARWGAGKLAFLKYADDDASAPERGDEDSPPVIETEAAELASLPPGAALDTFDPRYPDQAVGPFVAHFLRRSATGLGVSYSSLSNDLSGANFSSLRAGLAEEREEWRELQTWLAEHLLDQIFGAWLEAAVFSGALRPYGVADLARLRPAGWRGRTWPSITPKEEATTWQALYELGALTPSALAERMGRDRDELVDEWREDLEAGGGLFPPPGKRDAVASEAGPPGDDNGGSSG